MNQTFFVVVLFFLLFLCLPLPATIFSVEGTIGSNGTDEFLYVHYKTGYAPLLNTAFYLEQKFKRLILTHSWQAGFQFTNRYMKNFLLYYTDYTFDIYSETEYRLTCTKRTFYPARPIWGASFGVLDRFATYSIGKLLYFSENSFIPYSSIFMGIGYDPFKFLSFIHYHETTFGVGIRSDFIKNDFFQNRAQIVVAQSMHIEAQCNVSSRATLLIQWKNKLYALLDFEDIVGRVFWSNSIVTGIRYAIN